VYGEKNSKAPDLAANYKSIKRSLDINTQAIQFSWIEMQLIPIDKLLAHPNTTITGLKYDSLELGRRVVNIEFATAPEKAMLGDVAPINIAGLSGSMKLQEEHNWRPAQWRLKTRKVGEIQIKYDKHRLINGHQIPTELQRDVLQSDGLKWNQVKDSLNSFEYDADFEPDVFTLQEYGLRKIPAGGDGDKP
jgi:hypothetical protein